MAYSECSRCGATVPDNLSYGDSCPNCGAKFVFPWAAVLLGIGVFMLLIAIPLVIDPVGNEKESPVPEAVAKQIDILQKNKEGSDSGEPDLESELEAINELRNLGSRAVTAAPLLLERLGQDTGQAAADALAQIAPGELQSWLHEKVNATFQHEEDANAIVDALRALGDDGVDIKFQLLHRIGSKRTEGRIARIVFRELGEDGRLAIPGILAARRDVANTRYYAEIDEILDATGRDGSDSAAFYVRRFMDEAREGKVDIWNGGIGSEGVGFEPEQGRHWVHWLRSIPDSAIEELEVYLQSEEDGIFALRMIQSLDLSEADRCRRQFPHLKDTPFRDVQERKLKRER